MRTSASWCELEPRAGGDQVAEDHVLLQADQVVDLARQGRLGQHLGRLLEAGRRDEAVGLHGRLGDAQEQRAGRGRLGLVATWPCSSPAASTRSVLLLEARRVGTMSPSLKSVSPGSLILHALPSAPRCLPRNSNLSMTAPGSRPVSPTRLDLHLAEHLGDDDLDVLVVDLHALRAVDVLDLAQQVLLHGLFAARCGGCRAGRAARRPAASPAST